MLLKHFSFILFVALLFQLFWEVLIFCFYGLGREKKWNIQNGGKFYVRVRFFLRFSLIFIYCLFMNKYLYDGGMVGR